MVAVEVALTPFAERSYKAGVEFLGGLGSIGEGSNGQCNEVEVGILEDSRAVVDEGVDFLAP